MLKASHAKLYFRLHLDTDMKGAELKFWTTPPNFLLVATFNNEIAGIVAIQKKTDDVAELHRLSVKSELRRLGIARALVQATIDECKKRGFKSVYFETTDAQKEAVKFYDSFGFRNLGQFIPESNVLFPIPNIIYGIMIKKYIYNL
jgi:ribosomal protein S18 acetylase RimI-like enzyme